MFLNNCSRKENNKTAGCKLSVEEINVFRKILSDLRNKINQDKFILTFLSISLSTGNNRHKSDRKKSNVIKYFMPNNIREKIPVCLKTFT